MSNKRYYWFKLSEDFFKNRKIKQLRKLAGGDTFTLIYMKMLLLVLPTQGMYEIEEFESIPESIALDIDEDIDNVQVTLEFLKRTNLMIEIDGTSVEFSQVKDLIGSESDSAARVRKCREKKKSEALQCNDSVTQVLQNSDDRVRDRDRDRVRDRDRDREEIETELDVEREKENNTLSQSSTSSTPTSNNTLTSAEYTTLVTVYGKDLVDQKVANAKNYKNCLNFKTIRNWCNEEVEKEVEKDMRANGFYQ